MILIDNVQYLKQTNPLLFENISKLEAVINNLPYSVIKSKSGLSNIQVTHQDQSQVLHSKYDPLKEAERFVEQFSSFEVEQYDHVFFYGTGMGYHIELFMQKFPLMNFSMYEPIAPIFYHYLNERKLNSLPLHRLKNIFVEFTPEFMQVQLNDFIKQLNEKVLFVVLPSYERLFGEQYERFAKEFRNAVANKRASLHINMAFEKRWTINSLATMQFSLQSPNILMTKKDLFIGKPAILVSAGPSLEEELGHLKYIKENGLAYIFSVGSSIKALLANGIYPDAVCSYDPQPNTIETYTQIIQDQIETIPLVYGTSVGFETVRNYPGPKLHMVTSQDSVAPLYLKSEDQTSLAIVSDAPSIAVVTLELLYKLGVNPIVLVGQNFAYKNNQYYASGVEYQTQSQNRPTGLSEAELTNALQVESVDGSMIYTYDAFNRMRFQMEAYTRQYKDREIINTTQGGAKIADTTFRPLEELIEQRFKEKIVDSTWYEARDVENAYDLTYAKKQREMIEQEIKEFNDRIKRMGQILHEMRSLYDHKNEKHLDKQFPILDKEFKKLKKNKLFDALLLPMNRVEYEMLGRNVTQVRFESNILLKSKKIIDAFGSFLYRCQQEINMIQPLIQEVHQAIEQLSLSKATVKSN